MFTVNICEKCNRHLTDTEVKFYGFKCTECIYQELNKERIKQNEFINLK